MNHQKLIASGAEANILLDEKDNLVVKDRISKGYRLKQIDEKLRKTRTRSETKLLEKASKIINTPKPKETDLKNKNNTKITMPYIQGKKLSEHLDELSKEQSMEICIKTGKAIAKLHDNNIIHGDLTTSNIILDKNNNIWLIDFGLGFHSQRIEDKAVDLHLIAQALEAKHFQHWKEYLSYILEGYKDSNNSNKVLEQLKKVESRGRYKDKY